MIRTLALAAVVATGLAAPALAESADNPSPAQSAEAKPAVRGNLFTQQQAREHLLHLGYTQVSELSKDENGVWRGSATKDGKTLSVAVDVKGTVAKN
jgi:putative membrane protein